jgi:hypothetical protein
MLAAAGKGQLDVVYLLGADEIDMSALGKAFVIYQGSHGDAGPSAPTSSCRAPPTPRRAPPTSMSRAARR